MNSVHLDEKHRVFKPQQLMSDSVKLRLDIFNAAKEITEKYQLQLFNKVTRSTIDSILQDLDNIIEFYENAPSSYSEKYLLFPEVKNEKYIKEHLLIYLSYLRQAPVFVLHGNKFSKKIYGLQKYSAEFIQGQMYSSEPIIIYNDSSLYTKDIYKHRFAAVSVHEKSLLSWINAYMLQNQLNVL